MGKSISNEEFKRRVFEKINKEDLLIISEFKTLKDKLKVKTKFGYHICTPQSLLNGNVPTIRSALDPQDFYLRQVTEVHGDKYNYSGVVYKDAKSKVAIVCPKHGEFLQAANKHKDGSGCPKCITKKERRASNKAFVEGPLERYLERFSLNLCSYTSNTAPIIVKCSSHDEFTVTYREVISEVGCKECKSEKEVIKNISPEKIFKDKIKKLSPDIELIGSYRNYKSKVKVTDGELEFLMLPGNILRGHKLGIKSAVDKNAFCIRAFREKYGDKFDYSNVEYLGGQKEVEVVCRQHGSFSISPENHLAGDSCKKCTSEKRAKSQTKPKSHYVKRFKEVHGEKYDYSLFKTTHGKEEGKIVCKSHGVYTKSAVSHIRGAGCPKCGYESFKKLKRENPIGWNYSKWIESAEKSKHFESYKVYILRCWNEGEMFFKVGRTFRKIKERFNGVSQMPYHFEVIKVITNEDGRYICELETSIKKSNREYSYTPKIYFPGMCECFSEINQTVSENEEYK